MRDVYSNDVATAAVLAYRSEEWRPIVPERPQAEHDELQRIAQTRPCPTCEVGVGVECVDVVHEDRRPYRYQGGRVASHTLRFPADAQEQLGAWRRERHEAWRASLCETCHRGPGHCECAA